MTNRPLQKNPKSNSEIKSWPTIKWRAFPEKFIAGTDEVGRGCLAGPVYAAAVILDPGTVLRGLTDSKLLNSDERLEFAEKIKSKAICWSIGVASVEEIEEINILHASLLAMKRALETLTVIPELVLVDGRFQTKGPWPQKTFVKGDLRCQPISAASIIAKVARDGFMMNLDKEFPGYGFASHKGYGTPEHHKAIETFGLTRHHRRLFAPIRNFLEIEKLGEPGTEGRRPGL